MNTKGRFVRARNKVWSAAGVMALAELTNFTPKLLQTVQSLVSMAGEEATPQSHRMLRRISKAKINGKLLNFEEEGWSIFRLSTVSDDGLVRTYRPALEQLRSASITIDSWLSQGLTSHAFLDAVTRRNGSLRAEARQVLKNLASLYNTIMQAFSPALQRLKLRWDEAQKESTKNRQKEDGEPTITIVDSILYFEAHLDYCNCAVSAAILCETLAYIMRATDTVRGTRADMIELAQSFSLSSIPFIDRIFLLEPDVLHRQLLNFTPEENSKLAGQDLEALTRTAKKLHLFCSVFWEHGVNIIPTRIRCHTSGTKAIAIPRNKSKNGLAMTAGYDCLIKGWRLDTQQQVMQFSGHQSIVTDICFSNDGADKYLASASFDHTLRIWETATSKCSHILTGHGDAVTSCDFGLDGKLIVSSSLDKTVKVWSIHGGPALRTLDSHKAWVKAVRISHDGIHAVSASLDGRVCRWDVALPGAATQSPAKEVNGIESEKKAASTNNVVNVLIHDKIEASVDVLVHPCPALDVRLLGDDKAVSVGADGVSCMEIGMGIQQFVFTPLEKEAACALAISSDDAYVAVATLSQSVVVYHIASGDSEFLRMYGTTVVSLCFALNDNILLAGALDGTLIVIPRSRFMPVPIEED